ncbi:MAG: hypothetical protein MUE46_07940 [Xanthomonadales bacterium]|jgi:hypothetical protein|nr:hypothetical protein [Xanthomonadales bacterium]
MAPWGGARWVRLTGLAIKAGVCALLATLATALVFAGVEQLLSFFLAPICRTRQALLCDAARWWSSYWWISFLLLSRPLLVLWNLVFIRCFAQPGERLAVGGVQLTVVAADGLLWTLSAIASGSLDAMVPVWPILALLVIEKGDTALPLIAIILPVYLLVLATGIYCLRSGRKQTPLTVPER